MTVETEVYTFEGGVIYPFNPIPEQIDMEDVARGLANRCRWGGQVRRFYSVAEHSIMVACQCSDEFRLWGLLHDAAAAYLGEALEEYLEDGVYRGPDVTFFHVPDERGVVQRVSYRAVKDRLLRLILAAAARDLVVVMPDVVQAADMTIRRWEFRELVDPGTRGQSTFVPMSAEEARVKWLCAFRALVFNAELAAQESAA